MWDESRNNGNFSEVTEITEVLVKWQIYQILFETVN